MSLKIKIKKFFRNLSASEIIVALIVGLIMLLVGLAGCRAHVDPAPVAKQVVAAAVATAVPTLVPMRPLTGPKKSVNLIAGRGDTLSSIALNVYRDPALWPIIWWYNHDTIDNPDLIHEGEEILYPRWTSRMEKEIAIEYAAKEPKFQGLNNRVREFDVPFK